MASTSDSRGDTVTAPPRCRYAIYIFARRAPFLNIMLSKEHANAGNHQAEREQSTHIGTELLGELNLLPHTIAIVANVTVTRSRCVSFKCTQTRLFAERSSEKERTITLCVARLQRLDTHII